MKKVFLILIILATGYWLWASVVVAVERPYWATPAATVRNATRAGALIAKLDTVAKVSGPISALGTSSFTVNGVTVNISSTTILLRRFGAKSALSEFSVGDQVQVLGKWTDTNKTAVNARIIRNLSIQKRHGTFVGTISTTNSSGFTLATLARGMQTVTVGTTTKYADRKGTAISFTSLLSGHKVLVNGLWDNKLNTITEVVFVRDYSLPATSSATPR